MVHILAVIIGLIQQILMQKCAPIEVIVNVFVTIAVIAMIIVYMFQW